MFNFAHSVREHYIPTLLQLKTAMGVVFSSETILLKCNTVFNFNKLLSKASIKEKHFTLDSKDEYGGCSPFLNLLASLPSLFS